MRAQRAILVAALIPAFSAGAGLLVGIFLWTSWRSGLLGKWVILGAILLRASVPLPAKRLFMEHVLNPVPGSVTEIKVDQPRVSDGQGYAFHFKISDNDLDRILASRPFERIFNVTYGDGALYHGDWSAPLLVLYSPGYEPEWFIRRKICGSEGYAYAEVKDRQQYTWVLLCNRELQEAYFFAFKGDG